MIQHASQFPSTIFMATESGTRLLCMLLPALLVAIATPLAAQSSVDERKQAWSQHVKMRVESPFRELEWRPVGPRKQGGRIESIAVHPDETAIMYVGVGSGNLWKTVNNGLTWKPVFENESSFSIGDVTIAPTSPDIIWVGTGEELMARSSFAGTGVFKSTDAGESWTNMGLEDTHHIGRVLVHPRDPSIVYVAAIGHLYSDNEQRGVFKTTDGGATWSRVLFVDAKSGVTDLEMDPADPDILFASTWQHERKAWGHQAYGSGSRIYKSVNGGDTWVQLKNGLPSGEHVGRIAIHIAPSNPAVLYALLDLQGEDDALYRTDDSGASWRQVNKDKVAAGYDFCMVRASPDNPDELYLPGQSTLFSKDGGSTFSKIGGKVLHLLRHGSKTLHLDAHAFWINPRNPKHIVAGNDGGLHISYDRCSTWLHLNNLPIGEFYAIWADNAEPYNIFGGTQDNAALFGPADHVPADDAQDPWQHVYLDHWGGGDSYFTYPDPSDPNVIYYEHQFGDLRRKDMLTGESKRIRPRRNSIIDFDPEEPGLRTNWMTPFLISRYDTKTLYYASSRLFKSLDRGDHWSTISPELSTAPGPDRQGNIPFGTVSSLSESPLSQGLLYAGTDDGNVQVTRNDGRTWTKIRVGLPDKWVSRVCASQHDKATVFVTLTGYREDDFSAYVYKSTDYGQTWTSIAANLPGVPVNVICEDPTRRGILYLGSDLGAYVSINDGEEWQALSHGLPTTPVHDLFVQVREGELIAGTHGRSIFVLDVKAVQALGSEADERR